MTKILETSFEYPAWNRGQIGHCDLRVYQLGRGQELFSPRSTYVVIFAEPLDYDGLSVTNGCERIATARRLPKEGIFRPGDIRLGADGERTCGPTPGVAPRQPGMGGRANQGNMERMI